MPIIRLSFTPRLGAHRADDTAGRTRLTRNTADTTAGGERPWAAGDRAGPAGNQAGPAGDRARPDRPGYAGGAPPRGDDADRRDDRDEKAVGRFVEELASALTEMGVPRMPARVFAALLTTDSGRLTAADLATNLQVSPAAVSGAVRYLIQIGMVRRESEPGSRRHFYRAPDNVWDEVIGIRDHLMARWTGVLREGVEILGGDTPAGERVAESVRFFEFVSSELPSVIRKWRERGPGGDGPAARGR
jgi:predicted transcriptional regulator